MSKKYWLMKTEPDVYSIDDIKKDKTACWEGVRNYQARNFMRDEMKKGDEVLFYHSNAKPAGIVGLATIHKEGYPDYYAFDTKSKYFDPKSSKDNPRWIMVDLKFKKKFNKILSLSEIKEHPILKDMLVAKKGQRLSIQPVSEEHFKLIAEISN